jgi:hypothetical protein
MRLLLLSGRNDVSRRRNDRRSVECLAASTLVV